MAWNEIILTFEVVVVICLLIYILYIFKRREVIEDFTFTITVADHHAFKEGDIIRYPADDRYLYLEVLEIEGNTFTVKPAEHGNNSN